MIVNSSLASNIDKFVVMMAMVFHLLFHGDRIMTRISKLAGCGDAISMRWHSIRRGLRYQVSETTSVRIVVCSLACCAAMTMTIEKGLCQVLTKQAV